MKARTTRWSSIVFRRLVKLIVVAGAGAGILSCTSTPAPPAGSSPPAVTTQSPSAPKPPSPRTPPLAAPAVHPLTAAELGASWRRGCPLEPGRLRRVELDFVGFDGQTHRGALIVHQDLVADVIAIFESLHRLRYPIEKMRTVDSYPGADDELSISAPRGDRWL